MHTLTSIWHWLLNVTGTNIPASGSKWYNFWSGFGSDLGELLIIGALFAWYKRNKCVCCWRLSHHDVANTHFRTCHRHFTEADHKKLQKIHEKEFPQMHEFLEKMETKK